jgi:hypothetical protein
MGSETTVVIDRRIDDVYKPLPSTRHPVDAGTRSAYTVDVSRPVIPWRWSRVLLAPAELLAVVWSIPFVILILGIPLVLAVAVIHWVGRLLLSAF